MRISFFIGSLRRAGAERVLSILANHYADLGHDIEIVLLLSDEVGYELNPTIRIVRMVGKQKSHIANLPFWVNGIRKYIKTREPEKLVSFAGRINVLLLMASIGMGIPVIVSERNDPMHDGRSKLMLKICDIMYKVSDAIVFQTKYEKSCFSKSIGGKSYIIPNPVRVNIRNVPKVENWVTTAGRLLPQKNHKMLIETASILKSRNLQLRIDIFGDGSLKDDLIKLIKEKNIEDTVFLRGNVSDLHERIQGSTIFVMTSDYEGLSNSLIEAQMMGFPCISTDYPGADELIKNRVNGIIVKRNDAFELANAIQELIENPELRSSLQDNALENAKNYTFDVVLKQWDNVILGGE